MQDRYVGDIGDFAKYSLLRALSNNLGLGVSWYLCPDERNNDGRHTDYLNDPDKWRFRDKEVFDCLKEVVSTNRSIGEIQRRKILADNTVFFGRRLDFSGCTRSTQKGWRDKWFADSVKCLECCDLIFADPDNGLKESGRFRPGLRKHAKSISEDEAMALAAINRPVIVYHHNTRRRGGHDAEVRRWQERLGRLTCAAVRWRVVSPRTFFILNCTDELERHAEGWCKRWGSCKVYLTPRQGRDSSPSQPLIRDSEAKGAAW